MALPMVEDTCRTITKKTETRIFRYGRGGVKLFTGTREIVKKVQTVIENGATRNRENWKRRRKSW